MAPCRPPNAAAVLLENPTSPVCLQLLHSKCTVTLKRAATHHWPCALPKPAAGPDHGIHRARVERLHLLEILESPQRCCTDPVGVFLKKKLSIEKLIVLTKRARTLTRNKIKLPSPTTCLQVSPGYGKPAQGTVESELSTRLLSRENPHRGLQRAHLLETRHGTASRARAAARGPAPSRALCPHPVHGTPEPL